jgi:hypothetical protein
MKVERLHFPSLSGPAIFDSAARLLTLVFTVAAVVLAGRWLTELTAPRPVAELPSAALAQPEVGTGVISRLFASAKVESQVQALEGLRLTGVYAGSRGGGFATIQTRSGDVAVFPGDEVAPGIVLKHIEGKRVILLAAGVEKEMMLRESPAPGASASLPVPASPPAIPNRPPQPVEAERE